MDAIKIHYKFQTGAFLWNQKLEEFCVHTILKTISAKSHKKKNAKDNHFTGTQL